MNNIYVSMFDLEKAYAWYDSSETETLSLCQSCPIGPLKVTIGY